jgi:hypothetical protein
MIFASYGDQNPQWKGTIEEEDGVKVIKNPNAPLYGEITFDLEEDLSIGNEEDENYMLYRTELPVVDKEGNIFVLDSENFRIQKYDRNGKYLKSIGRKGQGPGEFEEPLRLHLDTNDNIYVLDRRMIHGFKNNGELLSTITSKEWIFRLIREFRVLKEGNIICNTTSRERKDGKPTDYSFSNIDFFDSEGKLVETIATYSRKMDFLKVSERGRISPPNYHESQLYFSPIDEELSVYGYSSEYMLFVINLSRNIVFKIEKDENPQPIPDEVKDKALDYCIEKFIERLKNRAWGREFSRGEIREAMNFPKYMPYFCNIISDDKERIYVRQFKSPWTENEGVEYDIFNRDGYFLYRLKLSKIIDTLKNGYLYRVERDEGTGYAKIKCYRIKNWDQIRVGL